MVSPAQRQIETPVSKQRFVHKAKVINVATLNVFSRQFGQALVFQFSYISENEQLFCHVSYHQEVSGHLYAWPPQLGFEALAFSLVGGRSATACSPKIPIQLEWHVIGWIPCKATSATLRMPATFRALNVRNSVCPLPKPAFLISLSLGTRRFSGAMQLSTAPPIQKL